MDVRWKDLRSVKDVSESTISTLDFNKQTIWPRGKKKIANRLLKAGMNPGLGIKGLHKKGITGAGVTLDGKDDPTFTLRMHFEHRLKNIIPRSIHISLQVGEESAGQYHMLQEY